MAVARRRMHGTVMTTCLSRRWERPGSAGILQGQVLSLEHCYTRAGAAGSLEHMDIPLGNKELRAVVVILRVVVQSSQLDIGEELSHQR